MLGMPIIGHFMAYKSGHRLNNLLLKELMAKKIVGKLLIVSIKKKSISFIHLKIPSFRILDAIQV